MAQAILRRLLFALPVLLGVSTLSFLLIRFVPGDPIDIMLGDQAQVADKEALRELLGLNKSLTEQLATSYEGLLTLDMGVSIQSRQSVSEAIFSRVPATVELSLTAMMIALMVGIPLGVLASVKRGTLFEKFTALYGLIGMSTPGFWLGPMLILIFAVKLDWLPVSERSGLSSVILPAMTLAFGLSAILAQITRASMIEVNREDYVRVARAKGASSFRVWFKHALANAMMPIITIVGLQFGALLTGTVIVETIFDWPGVGTLLFRAIQSRDYPMVQGCVLFISITYVVVNLLTDIAYTIANPKVRVS